jgi:hypothetical protein
MNALDFVFEPHNYIPTNFPFPFTVPATSSLLSATASTVATVTTAAPTETAGADGAVAFNVSSPLGFLLYVAAQSQKLFGTGAQGGLLFSGPTRSYWLLTLFMVPTYPFPPLVFSGTNRGDSMRL